MQKELYNTDLKGVNCIPLIEAKWHDRFLPLGCSFSADL